MLSEPGTSFDDAFPYGYPTLTEKNNDEDFEAVSASSAKKKGTRQNSKLYKTVKLGKEDFHSKSTQYRMWLLEEKQIDLDNLPRKKAVEFFEKFCKKWNRSKLNQKYYKTSGSLWIAASPEAHSKLNLESKLATAVASGHYGKSSACQFGTFGKKHARKGLEECVNEGSIAEVSPYATSEAMPPSLQSLFHPKSPVNDNYPTISRRPRMNIVKTESFYAPISVDKTSSIGRRKGLRFLKSRYRTEG